MFDELWLNDELSEENLERELKECNEFKKDLKYEKKKIKYVQYIHYRNFHRNAVFHKIFLEVDQTYFFENKKSILNHRIHFCMGILFERSHEVLSLFLLQKIRGNNALYDDERNTILIPIFDFGKTGFPTCDIFSKDRNCKFKVVYTINPKKEKKLRDFFSIFVYETVETNFAKKTDMIIFDTYLDNSVFLTLHFQSDSDVVLENIILNYKDRVNKSIQSKTFEKQDLLIVEIFEEKFYIVPLIRQCGNFELLVKNIFDEDFLISKHEENNHFLYETNENKRLELHSMKINGFNLKYDYFRDLKIGTYCLESFNSD